MSSTVFFHDGFHLRWFRAGEARASSAAAAPPTTQPAVNSQVPAGRGQTTSSAASSSARRAPPAQPRSIRGSYCLLGLIFADVFLLVMAGVALVQAGITPMPLVPLVINRLAELLVMVCTNSVIHLWMSVIQVILAVLACVLFKFADPGCENIAFDFANQIHRCGAIMLGIVACVMELSILGAEVIYHVHFGNLWAPRQLEGDSVPASDYSFMFTRQPQSGLPWPPTTNGHTSKDVYVTVSTPNGGNFQVARVLPGGSTAGTPTSAGGEAYPDSPTVMEAGGSPPLAMHLYQLNPRALAATNWLREGSVASDWWQMPTEDGSPQLTIRGMDGAAIPLEDVPSFRPVAGRQGRRAPVRFSRTRRAAGAQGTPPPADADATAGAGSGGMTVEVASPATTASPSSPEPTAAAASDTSPVRRVLPLSAGERERAGTAPGGAAEAGRAAEASPAGEPAGSRE
eukprot:jgi/Tetstr1/437895/TSEL_026526.t1